MAIYMGYLNSDRKPTDTTKISESTENRSDISKDISKLPVADVESKFKSSVVVQPPSASTNANIDIDFDSALDDLIDALSAEDRARIENAIADAKANNNGMSLTLVDQSEIVMNTYEQLVNENNQASQLARESVEAANQSYQNTLTYVNNTKNAARSEIERLQAIPKYKVVDDAKNKMDTKQNEYESLVTSFRDVENQVNTISAEFETLLYTNQANFESINTMKNDKVNIENELNILRETVGPNDPEYMKKVDEYSDLSDKLRVLEETHADNIVAMNQKELQLKNTMDYSDKLKIDVDNKRKEYNDARIAYENIDMDKVEADYNNILDEIERNQNILNTIDSEAEIAYNEYLKKQDEYSVLLSRQSDLEENYRLAKQAYEEADATNKKILENNAKIDAQLEAKNRQLQQAITELEAAKKKDADARLTLERAKDNKALADKQLAQAKKDVKAAQTKAKKTNTAQSALVDYNKETSAYLDAQKKASAMLKDVTLKNNKVTDANKVVKSTSNKLKSAQKKVNTLKSDISGLKSKVQSSSSNASDNMLLNSTINTISVESVLSKINKNLHIPNPTDTVYASIEKYSKYYNRFKKPDLTTILRNGYPHVFFVRPSCNILDKNYNLISSMKGNPDFTYAAKSAKWLLRELIASNGQNHDFMLYPSAYASSFSLSDEYITTTTYGKNYVGDAIAFGQSNIESKTAGTFEIQFRDDKRLHIYQLHKLWTEYISGCYLGDLWTSSNNIKKKILDYVGAVYYIVTAEDGETIIFWSKYYGVFPTQIPSTQYSWGAGNTITDTNISIQYQYSSKTDYNPKSIVEFNYNSRCKENTKYMPIYDKNLNGVGRTMVGVPFITMETNDVSGCPYVLKLRFRDPGVDI